MKKAKRPSTRTSANDLSRLARERADEQARRIPWKRLFEGRNQYTDWQEFNLWVRSIVEIEDRVPDWLSSIVEDRCPGFLEAEKGNRAVNSRTLPLRLEDWVDEHVFAFAKNEGWFDAITYYAIRDPRYQRAETCWAEYVAKWKQAKPIHYPSLEEWRVTAAAADDTARLVANERRARRSSKLVNRDRLCEAVASYIDWEAFTDWARPALERCTQLPDEVAGELQRRCPGFLDVNIARAEQARKNVACRWEQLMTWIADHFFADAKGEGWFDAMLIQVRSHPRAVRTAEYADHCDELWNREMPAPYPSFDDWRRDADSYIDIHD